MPTDRRSRSDRPDPLRDPGALAPGGGSAEEPTAAPYRKSERLLNLLMTLRRARTGLSREQIRTQVRGYDDSLSTSAFERKFERDKEELRALGVPIVTLFDTTGAASGYRIAQDWALHPIDLDPAQLALLGLAARLWQGADLAPAATNALRKVEARLGMRSTRVPAEQPVVPVAGLAADSPVLTTLIRACAARATVLFDYRKPGGEPEPRRVQPWGVVSWRGHWYLVGHDVQRAQQRVFRASRIVSEVRPDPDAPAYDIPRDFDARQAVGQFAGETRRVIEVSVPPGRAAALRRTAEPLGTAADGRDLLGLSTHDLAAGVATVLAHAPRAQVAGPPAAVAEAQRQLGAVLAGQRSASPTARAVLGPKRRGSDSAQFQRLLALVPWLAANSGVSVEAAAAHFGVSAEQLVADLGSIITSGADDWTLFDIQYWDDDGIIRVIDALELREPLALTPDEGFALLAALQALAAIPGSHDRDLLVATERTLAAALGSPVTADLGVAVRVDLPGEVVDPITAALADGRALEVRYLGAVRDEVTERTVDPVAVVVIDGHAYLRAHCRRADALRLFRLDRILQVAVSSLAAAPVAGGSAEVEPMSATLSGTGRTVVVDVPAGSAVLETHPTIRRWSLPGDWVRAELPVGDYAWAEQLVLGGAGEVILRQPAWLAERIVEVAAAALDA